MKLEDVDISLKLKGHFGCVEYEEAACELVKYLWDNDRQPSIPFWLDFGKGVEWEKKFTMEDVNINPMYFSMMCASGWISNTWFPKGSFVVSEAFINRINEKQT